MKSKKVILASTLCVAIFTLAIMLLVGQPARAAGPWYVEPGGNDGNSCLNFGPANACATINGAIGKASSGDTIYVAIGTYTGTGNEVVLLDKSVTLSGGWNSSFTTQSGTSTIDGQGARKGMTVNSSVTVIVELFTVQNGNSSEWNSTWGGGIHNGGTLTLNNTALFGNTSRFGGGIHNGGTVTLNNSTVSGNTAHLSEYSSGGGINNRGTVTLNNSTVSGNQATSSRPSGGGIATDGGGTVTLNSSTVSGNTATGSFARGGGGIRIWNSTVTLNNSTVSGNTATGSFAIGGGIGISGGTVTLQNSIIAGNTGDDAPDCWGTIGSAGHNLVGDTSGCTFTPTTGDLINTDPLLGPLQDNDGDTETHALLTGSPAIDAGSCSGTTADQRGKPRPIDKAGVANADDGCDIGAFEVQISTSIQVEKLANVSQVSVGEIISYTYWVTNTGDITLNPVSASDDKLGNVPLGLTMLTPGQATTGILTHTVITPDLPGPLINTVIVTGNLVTDTDTATVDVISPISPVYLPIVLKNS